MNWSELKGVAIIYAAVGTIVAAAILIRWATGWVPLWQGL